jgi:RNA polymerase sigma-70 factor (ECF subfamily)
MTIVRLPFFAARSGTLTVKPPSKVSAEALGSVSLLYEEVRNGDERAVSELWKRFLPRLLGLARKALKGRELRHADSDDVVQSAFMSFWKGASGGQFDQPANRESLWNLLGVITVRKARKLIEREQTAKRGGGRRAGNDANRPEPAGPDTVAFDAFCSELFELLDDELQGFAALRMMGHTNREVAELLRCSERKVERKLQLIRAVWEDELNEG